MSKFKTIKDILKRINKFLLTANNEISLFKRNPNFVLRHSTLFSLIVLLFPLISYFIFIYLLPFRSIYAAILWVMLFVIIIIFYIFYYSKELTDVSFFIDIRSRIILKAAKKGLKFTDLNKTEVKLFLLSRLISKYVIFLLLDIFLYIIIPFALIFYTIEYITPNSFSRSYINDSPIKILEYIYFSAITITTTGYGDIIPKNYLAQIACAVEVALGILTIVCQVSGILSSSSAYFDQIDELFLEMKKKGFNYQKEILYAKNFRTALKIFRLTYISIFLILILLFILKIIFISKS
jgi:hypothetical protein